MGQVNYLVYPGTSGAYSLDYIIGDAVVVSFTRDNTNI